jgi:hydroxymethylglutaryl-CoA lyase
MNYPKCAISFMNFCLSDKTLLNKYLTHVASKNVRPFDVTLRDGLQSLSKENQLLFMTSKKREMYYDILRKYNPKKLEIGSCINYKVLPIFSDTRELFEQINRTKSYDNYILVPNEDQLLQALSFGVSNFSFITSVSESFQMKNTRMTLNDNFARLTNMMLLLNDFNMSNNLFTVKLYVSCINECPIEGHIHTNEVVDKLVQLRNALNPDMLCLSDTCGTLTPSSFLQIIKGLKTNRFDYSKLSLHLHVAPDRENDIETIVHLALDNGIVEFDVSDLASGGCSVTMEASKLAPNLSYVQYYKFLATYLLQKKSN